MNPLILSNQHRPSDDPIFALNREATERRRRGEAVVNATIGTLLDDDGKLAILPTASRAVREVRAEEWAAYAPIAGTTDFLEATMDDLLRNEPALRERAVAVATPGGSGALRHAVCNYLEPGQALVTPSFYWGPYHTLADEAGRRLATFPMFTEGGAFNVAGLDATLSALIATQGRALVFINDPCHNPTGYSLRASEWASLVECIAQHAATAPTTLLVDCAYVAYGEQDPYGFLRAVRPLADCASVLFAWSASKTFTHYGLRVGALVACSADERVRAMTEAALSYSCRGTWSNCNRGGLAAITRLLRDPELSRACGIERDRMKASLRGRVAAFNALAPPRGIPYPRYDGGFFVTVFAEQAHEKAAAMAHEGVFVVPQKGALRVALCSVAERDIVRLVDALARHL